MSKWSVVNGKTWTLNTKYKVVFNKLPCYTLICTCELYNNNIHMVIARVKREERPFIGDLVMDEERM